MNHNIKLGTYKHYKGHICTVLGIAIHTENETELVIYTHPHDGKEQLWARPLEMFIENITTDDYNGPRFEYIGE